MKGKQQERVELNGLKIIPLGGLEQIGMNITAFEYEDSIIVVDCGLSFPDDDMLGIDLVIPDVDYLKQVVAKAGLSPATPAVPALAAPELSVVSETGAWPPSVPEPESEDPEEQMIDDMEENLSLEASNLDLIAKVLKKHGGNRKEAAEELGISERTLYRKLKMIKK